MNQSAPSPSSPQAGRSIFYRLPGGGSLPHEDGGALILGLLRELALRYALGRGEYLDDDQRRCLGVERWNSSLDFGHPLEDLHELRGIRFILRDGFPVMFILCHDGRITEPETLPLPVLSQILGEVIRTSRMTTRQRALYSPGIDSLYVNPLVGRVEEVSRGFHLVLVKGGPPLLVNSLGQTLRTPLSLFARLHEFKRLGTYRGTLYFAARGEVLLSSCPSPERVDSVMFDLGGHPCEFTVPGCQEYRNLEDISALFDAVVAKEGDDLPGSAPMIRRVGSGDSPDR